MTVDIRILNVSDAFKAAIHWYFFPDGDIYYVDFLRNPKKFTYTYRDVRISDEFIAYLKGPMFLGIIDDEHKEFRPDVVRMIEFLEDCQRNNIRLTI